MRGVRAVLFDLDGVLVDATEWHYEALNRALALFGFTITRYEHLSTYNGLPTKKKLEMLSVEKGLPCALHPTIGRIKQQYTRDEILGRCRPVFDKEYMLSRLAREGYRLAVCSNAVKESIELMLRQSGLLDYFEFYISNEDVERPKPDPEIYHRAIRRMDLTAGDIVIVEDSAPGIAAAERSGAYVCKVQGFEDTTYLKVREFINSLEFNEAN